jgi:nicotinamidase-related amidase
VEILALVTLLFGFPAAPTAFAQTIVDEWGAVKAPPAPELKPVTIDPKGTVLLMLDFVKQICNAERTPRCVASIPKAERLLAQARTKGVPVIHSLGGGAAVADILKEVAPLGGEPVVSSGPDKFFGTELEKLLKERGATSVIVAGTWAHGAVLYTGSGAALRGLKVIIPVDGMSAPNSYAEQYTAWHMANAPRISGQVTLTKIDLIR